MTQELLADLHRRGIKLRLTDGRLDVLAPPGALTPELRERLRLGRDELITLLLGTAIEEDLPDVSPRPEQRFDPFPLTDIQHAYWVGRGSALELGGVSCHYYFELESEGLDPQRLNQSLQQVIARHDMLRVTIQPDGKQRVLTETPAYDIALADLRGLAPDAQQEQIESIKGEMSHQVRPADRWPLFEIRAARLDNQRLRLHISLDVLIMDGLSLYLLFEDWRRFYKQPDWTPQPLTLSYRDYVLAEESTRDGERYKSAKEYWLQRLDELPPAPDLPLATPPAQLAQPTFTRRRTRVPRESWEAIKEQSRIEGLTPSSVLMTAFADVLRVWSQQSSFTLNLTLFNRPQIHPQIDQLIGDFTAVTLLEVTSGRGEPFTVRADRLQQQLLRDLEHKAYSGIRVLRERGRRLGGGPSAAMPIVFTSALVLTPSEGEEQSSGLRFFGEEVYGITQTPQVWLDHQVAEERGELVFNWDAVEALFPAGLLDDMFSLYCDVLSRLSQNPEAWKTTESFTRLPEWQVAERQRANHTTTETPATNLCELVEAQVRQRPEAVAVISHDGQFSYLEIVSQARRLARRLIELGATPNELVGVVLDKGWEQVAATIGINQSKAAYLPIDPQWPAMRREHLLAEGGVRIVVTSPSLRDALTWPVETLTITFTDPEVRENDSQPLNLVPSPVDTAYVIYTSGSTGQPKGVVIDHRGAANTIQDINSRFQVGPDDRILALSALTFDLSVYDIFGTLAAGGTVVMPSPTRVHEPAHWADLVKRHGVTMWNSVPALMQAWVDARGKTEDPSPSGLRLVLLSGDWIPVSLPDAVRVVHPEARLVSLGGATEASIWSVCYPIAEVPPEWNRIPYGKPLANQTLHIYNEWLEPCPVWTAGEIYIGGIGVAKEYWAAAEKTKDRFVIHPTTKERLYRTGDLGRYLPGGDIEFLGREDLQIKLNGHRIELDEIAVALRRQPGIGDAVVGVDANPKTGSRQLVAHVVPGHHPRLHASAADEPAPWQSVIEAGESELRQGLMDSASELATYRNVWWAIEELSPLIMARTLAQFGLFQNTGDTATSQEIVAEHDIKPTYRALIDRWMAVLAKQGVLRPSGQDGEYRCERALDVEVLDEQVRRGQDALSVSGSTGILVDYFASCAENQIRMLQGKVSPLELLLPDGDLRVTEALYAHNPVAQLQNRVVARVVRSFVDTHPKASSISILEVGAGTGATTAQVLQELPSERIHYRFTDVSAFFTDRAKGKFRTDTVIDYSLFDVDRQPSAQDIMAGSMNIVIAANVMHDAKDLNRSLGYLRSVLTPGGLLVLIEGTANSSVQMVTVGFIEGLSQDRTESRAPLLTVPEWRSGFHAAGFARTASIPHGDAAVDVDVQHVLMSQAPLSGSGLDTTELRRALELELPDYMVPRHYLAVDRIPLNANGKTDRSSLSTPWDNTATEERVTSRNHMEQILFEIWRDALERQDFGVEDNFFELGGDSLHAVSILGRLRDELGMEHDAEEGLEMLFDHPTIAELAAMLRDRAES